MILTFRLMFTFRLPPMLTFRLTLRFTFTLRCTRGPAIPGTVVEMRAKTVRQAIGWLMCWRKIFIMESMGTF